MNCPVCMSPCHPFFDPHRRVAYGDCPTCRYVFKTPDHHPDFADQKQRYDWHDNRADAPGYRAYFQRFLDGLLPQIPHRGRALDFGCGASDLLASMLEEAGFETTRYDPIYFPDARYRLAAYDLIVAVEVFEHLADPLGTIRHLSTLLASGGSLGIQTQFHPDDPARFLAWYYRLDPTHIGFFVPETFARLADASGLYFRADNGRNTVRLCR